MDKTSKPKAGGAYGGKAEEIDGDKSRKKEKGGGKARGEVKEKKDAEDKLLSHRDQKKPRATVTGATTLNSSAAGKNGDSPKSGKESPGSTQKSTSEKKGKRFSMSAVEGRNAKAYVDTARKEREEEESDEVQKPPSSSRSGKNTKHGKAVDSAGVRVSSSTAPHQQFSASPASTATPNSTSDATVLQHSAAPGMQDELQQAMALMKANRYWPPVDIDAAWLALNKNDSRDAQRFSEEGLATVKRAYAWAAKYEVERHEKCPLLQHPILNAVRHGTQSATWEELAAVPDQPLFSRLHKDLQKFLRMVADAASLLLGQPARFSAQALGVELDPAPAPLPVVKFKPRLQLCMPESQLPGYEDARTAIGNDALCPVKLEDFSIDEVTRELAHIEDGLLAGVVAEILHKGAWSTQLGTIYHEKRMLAGLRKFANVEILVMLSKTRPVPSFGKLSDRSQALLCLVSDLATIILWEAFQQLQKPQEQ